MNLRRRLHRIATTKVSPTATEALKRETTICSSTSLAALIPPCFSFLPSATANESYLFPSHSSRPSFLLQRVFLSFVPFFRLLHQQIKSGRERCFKAEGSGGLLSRVSTLSLHCTRAASPLEFGAGAKDATCAKPLITTFHSIRAKISIMLIHDGCRQAGCEARKRHSLEKHENVLAVQRCASWKRLVCARGKWRGEWMANGFRLRKAASVTDYCFLWLFAEQFEECLSIFRMFFLF